MKANNAIILSLFLCLLGINVKAQSPIVSKIEPPNWWTGMKNNSLQLMVYGHNFQNITASINSKEIILNKTTISPNNDYVFIDLTLLSKLKPGKYEVKLKNSKGESISVYPILERESSENKFKGFNSEDVIYLITPDRFSDGDTSNNVVKGYDNQYDRSNYRGRHGGDIQGIINKLDYIRDLGCNTLWITPVVDNNVGFLSYHGYAATDFYNVDARFGTNQLYKNLVTEAHNKGMKVILDHVSNHVSIDHPWIKNLPFADWINGTPNNFPPAVHHKMVFSDPHADSITINSVMRGWFIDYMPDLNQQNPFMAKYIIQNTIWWMEYAGLDGIREDTYPYNDQKFMAEWAKIILEEYPKTNIVGEVWSGDTPFLAAYQRGSKVGRSFNSFLPCLTDFGMRDIYYEYLMGKKKVFDIYNKFAMDFLFADFNNLVTFIDNHDVPRGMFGANGNIAKVKLAYLMLLTTRGIPQIFYGSEIGMVGTEDHGLLRGDFPGGFIQDRRTAFTSDGRTESENDIYNYIHKLLTLRKQNTALSSGKFIHFPPENDVYNYFKISGKQKIFISINSSDKPAELNISIYTNQLKVGAKLINMMSGEEFVFDGKNKPVVPAMTGNIYLVN